MLEREDYSRRINVNSNDQSDLAVFDIENPFTSYHIKEKLNADSVSPPREGFFEIEKDGKFFFLNSKNGKISRKFDALNSFYRGEAKVLIDKKWHVIDTEFNIIF